jgi:hypothetical protein
MPDLVKWQREYKSKGLQVIGVTNPPEQFAEACEFIKSIKVKCLKSFQGIIFPEEFEQKVKTLLR